MMHECSKFNGRLFICLAIGTWQSVSLRLVEGMCHVSSSCLQALAIIGGLKCAVILQDCRPLQLTSRKGTRFDFVGVAAVAKGTVPPEACFVPPDAVGSGKCRLA